MIKYNKIYVVAPYRYATGGIELAHQLVDYLKRKGLNAYIVYYDNNNISHDSNVTEAYRKYNITTTDEIEDISENFLMLPETFYDLILEYKNIQIGCWWMSVDNRYHSCCFSERLKFINSFDGKIRFIYKYILGKEKKYKNSITLMHKEEKRIFHFYQSRYAQYHLYSLGLSKVLPLSDYINTEFTLESNVKKENIVLYNPVKGFRFTKKIIKKMPNTNFIALRGLSRKQLNELMGRAKLYIDFGGFPGKDRLFREAAINNCCIITGKRGASSFYEDVCIGEKYKFNNKSSSIDNITNCINNIFMNYEDCIKDFEMLKLRTKKEKEYFYNEIEEFFIAK